MSSLRFQQNLMLPPQRVEISGGINLKMVPMTVDDVRLLWESLRMDNKSPLLQDHTVDILKHIDPGALGWYFTGHFIQGIESGKALKFWSLRVPEKEEPIGFTLIALGKRSSEDEAIQLNYGETGIFITDNDYWGKGIASLSHQIRTLYAFAPQYYDLDYLYTEIYEGNSPSRQAVEKVGYLYTGTKMAKVTHPHLRQESTAPINQFYCLNPYRAAEVADQLAQIGEVDLQTFDLEGAKTNTITAIENAKDILNR